MWLFLLSAVFAYIFLQSIYRLYFHPLSHIPGPKLAAISYLPHFYHSVIRGGKFLWEIEKMHKQYGPTVRINPREVHITDPSFYDEIYASGKRKRNKDRHLVAFNTSPLSTPATMDHDLHRARRSQMSHFFSKKAVLELNQGIQAKVSLLVKFIERAHANNTIVPMSSAFAALTGDIITHYLYGQDSQYMSSPDLSGNIIWDAIAEITNSSHVFEFFPIIPILLRSLPARLMRVVQPKLAAVYDRQDQIEEQSKQTLAEKGYLSSAGTIYQALIHPDIPPEERSLARLRDESFIVLVGGTETAGATLTFAAYHIIRNRSIYVKLQNELRGAMPTPTSFLDSSRLEQLPYLTGVINEALRLGAPALRSARVAPFEALKYKDYVIPPNTPVSTISHFVHRNKEIFPDPETFNPDRWVLAAEKGENLTKYLVTFTRGSRVCVGMNLACAELYLTIAALVRRFDLELYDTPPENMGFAREMIVQRPEKGVWTLKVRVVRVVEE
ncbi:benzoate 4-monooxygenase cytochrome P450 [Aspergillus ellipticus CBS 707.79]|uniref:Benzoate 4-monooxygenase cytochrome P450 n=1 Tax=Aspergillus ellipticus CBS 707.79 TaxID=1448320 RepID=A0A319DT91_9EURO|nr:benzoate 4-monooxygenase cytochrome P450 [Aspergillus ellipticus CBS 707.79]